MEQILQVILLKRDYENQMKFAFFIEDLCNIFRLPFPLPVSFQIFPTSSSIQLYAFSLFRKQTLSLQKTNRQNKQIRGFKNTEKNCTRNRLTHENKSHKNTHSMKGKVLSFNLCSWHLMCGCRLPDVFLFSKIKFQSHNCRHEVISNNVKVKFDLCSCG